MVISLVAKIGILGETACIPAWVFVQFADKVQENIIFLHAATSKMRHFIGKFPRRISFFYNSLCRKKRMNGDDFWRKCRGADGRVRIYCGKCKGFSAKSCIFATK